jgi:predicted TIM-barrel fold metal-dependent hydrolase
VSSLLAADSDRYRFPAAIAAFAGQINDADSHECVPIASWVDEFGSLMAPLRDACLGISSVLSGADEPLKKGDIPPAPKDEAAINAHNVWHLKMERAPGAIDLDRRLEVLDFTGIKRQIMFPGAGPIFAHALLGKADDLTVFRSIAGDRKAYAIEMIDACNAWCARVARRYDRLRPTAILVGDTPEDLYDRLKTLVGAGIRQVMISPDTPPGGRSPADPALDRVWALAADAGCSILAHIAISENFLKTLVWREAPAFKGWMVGAEFSLDPWTLSNIHLAVQNYLMTMILGGVFDRHPRLYFGSAEFTGHWIGPLGENMDRWYANTPFKQNIGERLLKLKPSEYLSRNVRVACFDFEPVGKYIERFGLEEVYCYASDFPHHEGGKDPMGNFAGSLAGASAVTLHKFFVENAKVILPD